MRGWKIAAVIGVAGLIVVSCSTERPSGDASATTTGPGPGPASSGGAEPTTDEVTPLVVTALGEPIPVKGSDDRFHVDYELQIFNDSPRPATITSLETVDASTDRVVGTLDAAGVVARSKLAGDAAANPQPVTSVPPGRTVFVVIDDTYASRDDVPPAFIHRIHADFAPPAADQAAYASVLYPASVTQTTAPVRLGPGEPIRIGAPLEGDGWFAGNACCVLNGHRGGGILPLSGRINASERYAVDWIQIDEARVAETVPQGLVPSYAGDPHLNSSYLAFDKPLLAVADATVASVVDSFDDLAPQPLPTQNAVPIEELGGNQIILDLGDGLYAFYGHVKRGSFTVAKGDKVKKGQVIARLGNSGNSSEAHLHFHVMRGPTPLGSTNWPFQIESFELHGTLSAAGLAATPPPSTRRDELVLDGDVSSFPNVTTGA